MNKYWTVKTKHTSNFPDPLFVNKNEKIWIGREDIEYPGWFFCKVQASNKEGWVPNSIIQRDSDPHRGTVLADYSARELNVEPGDKVESNRELNGWAWCISEEGVAGWLPLDILEEK